jgi:3-methyladenine DNA glycosylase/8-oxoguanine DNA glycosylase
MEEIGFHAGWGRLSAALRPFAPAPLLAMSDATLKAAGLSRVKIETLRRLAVAVDSGALNIGALARARDEVIHAKLNSI